MAVFNLVGSTLSSAEARACGLCGDFLKLSKAHVPPQAAGNTNAVLRAADIIVDKVRQPGRWSEGGMWVRGLCEACNNRAGGAFDRAYADFARQIGSLTSPSALALTVRRDEPPAAVFAPGLVSRAVMFGLFAINPRLRVLFPELANDLLGEDPLGAGPIRWPEKLALKVARTHPGFPDDGVISSGVWSMRVLTERVVHWSFGDIVWPPLMWCLVTTDHDSEASGLGPQITKPLEDVSNWLRFGPDRTSVDLRNVLSTLHTMPHPMLSRSNDWVEFMTRDGSDADAIVVFGRRP